MPRTIEQRARVICRAYNKTFQEHPEMQYKRLLQDILEFGTRTKSQQGVDAITLIGPHPLRFNLSKGFPVITDRNLDTKPSENLPIPIWQQALGEIFAFVNGVRTQTGLEEFGCPNFWPKFVTEKKCAKRGFLPGDLGDGSYGAAFHDFPTEEGPLNQFAEVIAEARANPDLRTLFVSPWIPQFIPRREGRRQRVVVAPCHGWVHLRIIDGKLTLHMFQRSCDTVVGLPSNLTQYGAGLTLAIAHVLGIEPHEYVHSFSDAHIYVDQIEKGIVDKLLSREPRSLPNVRLIDPPDNLFSFRRDHFVLENYNPHPGIKEIPVAI